MALVGEAERMSAPSRPLGRPGVGGRARRQSCEATRRVAAAIAAQPPSAVQATLRTLWAARDLTPQQATDLGNVFLRLGTTAANLAAGNRRFTAGERPPWRLR